MEILHIAYENKGRYGGMGTSIINLIDALRDSMAKNHLLIPTPPKECDTNFNMILSNISTYTNDGISPLNISRNCRLALRDIMFDIIHINGIWQYSTHCAAKLCRKNNKPYVITPHGMLYPETLHQSSWKKMPMFKIWFEKDIMESSCMHATCDSEKNHLRGLGYNGPIAVIGNPIKIEDITKYITDYKQQTRFQQQNHYLRCKIGFLGRLHPRKNVEAIMRGMAIARHRNDIELVVMGAGEPAYESFLRDEAKRLGVEKQVEFAGFVNGEDKFRRLAELSALFVPSDMENFGMIVPEALLVGTPVMASLGTPWKDLEDYKCGWWRDNSPESIAKVIDEVAETSPDELLRMGMRGRELVLDKYESSKVAAKMLKLYSWLLGQGPKPEFVYLS